ncbi:MAG: hypothetical protein Q9160_004670 [Pyrenula sp. 1 TL-2023]
MSIADDKFPSSVAFDAINQALQSDEANRTDAIKRAKAIFGFQLKNKEGESEGWFIDLKDKGEVGKGSALGAGRKTDATLVLSDEDFGKLVTGKANAQNLFMSGKLKIKGNMMLATKLEPVLKKAQTQAKL